MKANQAFKADDEAVSPVIGVILMVAITVVLAAVVFVLVSNLGKSSESAPNISFVQDTSAKTVKIVQAEAGTSWNEIQATVTCSAGNGGLSLNGSALTATSGTTTAIFNPVHATATVTGNDLLTVSCGTTTAGTTVSLSLLHKPSNSGIGSTWTFTY